MYISLKIHNTILTFRLVYYICFCPAGNKQQTLRQTSGWNVSFFHTKFATSQCIFLSLTSFSRQQFAIFFHSLKRQRIRDKEQRKRERERRGCFFFLKKRKVEREKRDVCVPFLRIQKGRILLLSTSVKDNLREGFTSIDCDGSYKSARIAARF